MWDKLRKQVAFERKDLRRLLEIHHGLIVQCEKVPPNAIELSALAAMLHAFYNGIENMLKRIAAEVDGRIPSGELWHRKLLQSMREPNESRAAVLSAALGERLREYLEFRHVFRHAYTFDLRWEKMRSRVPGYPRALRGRTGHVRPNGTGRPKLSKCLRTSGIYREAHSCRKSVKSRKAVEKHSICRACRGFRKRYTGDWFAAVFT